MLEALFGLAIKTPKTLPLDRQQPQLRTPPLGYLAYLLNRLPPVALPPSDRESTKHHEPAQTNSYPLPLPEHLICKQRRSPQH